nr:nucleoside deaminase [Actinomycetales bacterium]
MTITDADRPFLIRAVELAEQALASGDEPFGSVLVSEAGEVLFEDHNHVASGDHTQHPEFAIARWAVQNLSAAERTAAIVYTSGEHCPMCAAAHGWVGLGRIVYASAASQTAAWREELGAPPSPIASLPIQTVVPGAVVDGPDPELAERVRELHARRRRITQAEEKTTGEV